MISGCGLDNVRQILTEVSQSRRYDALLGGKDNFAHDRQSAAALQQIHPDVGLAAAANRAFIDRAVTHVAREHGIRQFLDIGCGLPHFPTVDHLARAVDPASRVVYVDVDEMVLTHSRGVLHYGTPPVAIVAGDLREPATFLTDRSLTATLDLDQPVVVLIAAVLHFIGDGAHEAVAQTMAAMPSGSMLLLTHGTGDFMDSDQIAAFTALPRQVHGDLVGRTKAEVARFFDGLDLITPGVVPTADWRRAEGDTTTAAMCAAYAGAGRKP